MRNRQEKETCAAVTLLLKMMSRRKTAEALVWALVMTGPITTPGLTATELRPRESPAKCAWT